MVDYIVGAGASASVLSMIFPTAKVVAPDSGKIPDLFYLWDEPIVKKFLDDFAIPYSPKLVKVGFFPKNPTRKQVDKYNKITFKTSTSLPSKGRREFKALLAKIPDPKIDMLQKVKNINFLEKKMHLTTDYTVNYERVFWTAPHDMTFYSPITFVRCACGKRKIKEDYVYLLDDELLDWKAYRIAKKDDEYVVEIAGMIGYLPNIINIIDIVSRKLGVELEVIDFYTRRVGHTVMSVQIPDMDRYGVWFLGRYAQLDHEVMISDVIKKAMKLGGRSE